jgi:ABC-type bacteriocin/lantibiotic exporter with double-glycine peptidase domain
MMILSEPSPVLAGILVGVGSVILPGGWVRRASWLVPLSAVCLFASYGELLGTPPFMGDAWRAGVCRQTSPASCGPAAAATLLAANGIPATEKELARLCLTTGDGTSARAIYRGLLLKTRGTDLRVEPFRGDIDALCKLKGPTLLNVRLDPGPNVDPKFQAVWGWKPGVPHSVVMFRRRGDGRFVIGDPATGRELWDLRAMQTLWHGEGYRLVPRRPGQPGPTTAP